MGFGSVLAFAVALLVAYNTRSDIQLGIVVTGAAAGFILWGQAVMFARLDALEGYAHEQSLKDQARPPGATS